MLRSVVLLAAIVYLTSSMAQFKAPDIPNYTQGQCIEKLCRNNSFECRSTNAQVRIADACTRQLDIACIDVTMSALSRFEKDDLDEIVEIARSCQYVYPASQSIVLANLSRFDRDDLDELSFINSRLWLAQPSCLYSAKSRLSRSDFDSIDDIKDVLNQCTGTFDTSCFEEACKRTWNCRFKSGVINALRKCISGPSKQDRRRL